MICSTPRRSSYLLPLLAACLVLGACAGDPDRVAGPGTGGDGAGVPPTEVDAVGIWDDGSPSYQAHYCVRPPGQSYGAGDGSSWDDALSDLPAQLERGAKYYVAAGEYDDAEPTDSGYADQTLDDPDQGEQFIAIVKATASDHGSDEGWDPAFAEGPARFGPFAFVTGHYIIDGQQGQGAVGHGIQISVKPEGCDSPHVMPLFFTWNAQSSFIGLHHLDISSCGAYGDPETPAQDAIYGYHTDDSLVSHVTLKHVYVHDTKRVLAFLLGWDDVLIEDCLFERSGRHHESSSLAMRDASNVVVRRNVFKDAVNVYVSLQGVQHVHIYSNVFVGTLEGWDIWNSIHSSQPLSNVFIYGNTFYNLTGLSTGVRFSGVTDNLRIVNNIWAHNRTNQIPLAGEHGHNAFWDNWRVDTEPHQDLDDAVDEPSAQIFDTDPFVDGANLDFHLVAPTESGESLQVPYDRDLDDTQRGTDGVWDRGAFEFAQP